MLYGVKINMYHFDFKTLVVGDSGTGKTSIMERYLRNKFLDLPNSQSIDLYTKRMYTLNCTINLYFYVIPGNMSLSYLLAARHEILANADGVYIVYDARKPDQIATITLWAKTIKELLSNPDSGQQIPAVLLSNKCDLHVMDETCYQLFRTTFCQDHGILELFVTSAKENMNITAAIDFLVYEMLKRAAYRRLENLIR